MAKAKNTKPDAKITAAEIRAPRAGSKLDCLLKLLLQKEGACLDEMTEATGWQSHTVRASMTALRKRGYTIEKRSGTNVTVWFIADRSAQ